MLPSKQQVLINILVCLEGSILLAFFKNKYRVLMTYGQRWKNQQRHDIIFYELI